MSCLYNTHVRHVNIFVGRSQKLRDVRALATVICVASHPIFRYYLVGSVLLEHNELRCCYTELGYKADPRLREPATHSQR